MQKRTQRTELTGERLQGLIRRIEKESPGLSYDALCLFAGESLVCRNSYVEVGSKSKRKVTVTPNVVRWMIESLGLETVGGRPEPASALRMSEIGRGQKKRGFAVSYGMGVDSTALLIWLGRMYENGRRPEYRPDLITFADVGNEKQETYAYEPVIRAYLKRVGFPDLVTVRYKPDWTKYGMYHTLEQDCLAKSMLPSWAYWRKGCSAKWKLGPQDKYRASRLECVRTWEAGQRVLVAIGYDAGPNDAKRRWKVQNDHLYEYVYPLIELGWSRERCLEEIRKEGLPGWEHQYGGEWLETGGVPVKSACWFCPSTKAEELIEFSKTPHGRDYLRGIVRMEINARPNLTRLEGLWGVTTAARPGSMAEFILTNGLLGESPNLLPVLQRYTFDCGERCVGCF